jgi:hypothetical protein
MHRTIEITVPPAHREELIRELQGLDDVIGLTVHEGASRKPRGDVIIVHALNRGADRVLGSADRIRQKTGSISVVTAEAGSFSDPAHHERIDKDNDESTWEEMETSLRNRGQLTFNFVALMALGGAIGATGLSLEPAAQAIAFVSASIIAPAFEPIAKLPLGLVVRNRRLLLDALWSFLAGYAALIGTAAMAVFVLQALGVTAIDKLVGNSEVNRIMHPPADSILISICAALAAMIIETTYRESLLAGPVIGLVVVPAACLVGAGVGVLNADLVFSGIRRFSIDLAFIVVFGLSVLALKQRLLHRRLPLG